MIDGGDDPSMRPTPPRSLRAMKQVQSAGPSMATRLTMTLLIVLALAELVLIVAMLMGGP